MRYINFLCSLFLIGCGPGFQVIEPPIIDLEFEPFIDQYVQDKGDITGWYGIKNIDITFRSHNTYIGVCYMKGNQRWIEIDPSWWFSHNDTDRYILLLHELGHCDLNRRHSAPASIMEPYHIGTTRYLANTNYFLQELFLQIPLDNTFSLTYSNIKEKGYGERTHDTCRTHRIGQDYIFGIPKN